MPAPELLYSKSRVNKAAERVRDYMLEPCVLDDAGTEQMNEDLEVIRSYRAVHQLPLTKATMGLRSMVRTEGFDCEISQRLKRMTTILDKLVRQPDMALARMQDLGGCRAVLNSVHEVRAVQRRIKRNGRERRVRDYIEDPAASGYRGVHVIVEYDNRLIEVQLRTQVQHLWAVTVERLGGSLDEDLKSGYGPPQVLGLLQGISQMQSIEEAGGVVDATLRAEVGRLRRVADDYLKGGASHGS